MLQFIFKSFRSSLEWVDPHVVHSFSCALIFLLWQSFADRSGTDPYLGVLLHALPGDLPGPVYFTRFRIPSFSPSGWPVFGLLPWLRIPCQDSELRCWRLSEQPAPRRLRHPGLATDGWCFAEKVFERIRWKNRLYWRPWSDRKQSLRLDRALRWKCLLAPKQNVVWCFEHWTGGSRAVPAFYPQSGSFSDMRFKFFRRVQNQI